MSPLSVMRILWLLWAIKSRLGKKNAWQSNLDWLKSRWWMVRYSTELISSRRRWREVRTVLLSWCRSDICSKHSLPSIFTSRYKISLRSQPSNSRSNVSELLSTGHQDPTTFSTTLAEASSTGPSWAQVSIKERLTRMGRDVGWGSQCFLASSCASATTNRISCTGLTWSSTIWAVRLMPRQSTERLTVGCSRPLVMVDLRRL